MVRRTFVLRPVGTDARRRVPAVPRCGRPVAGGAGPPGHRGRGRGARRPTRGSAGRRRGVVIAVPTRGPQLVGLAARVVVGGRGAVPARTCRSACVRACLLSPRTVPSPGAR